MRIFAILAAFVVTTVGTLHAQAMVSYADLVEKLSPAVVNISIKSEPKTISGLPQGQNPFAGTPFEHFFQGFQFDLDMPVQPQQALGSGVVISADGYVITNNHVVEHADEIIVKFNDNAKAYEATLVGRDSRNDLALLKLEAGTKIPAYATLGDSSTLRVGDAVLAIGNPFGLGGTVTKGIVSALGRQIGQGPYDDFIQTDAAINPGNSGGPLFNGKGEVVGINTAILSRTGGSNGIGFAIPIDTVKLIVEQIKEHGRPIRGWLGVQIQHVTKELAESFKLSEASGALVAQVVEGSPADKAGLKVGDIITTFNNQEIVEMSDLPKLVAETTVGNKVNMNIIRDGKKRTLSATIVELEEDTPAGMGTPSDGPTPAALGLTVVKLTPSTRVQTNVTEGVDGLLVTQVAFNSAAAKSGIRRGDVLVEADRQKLTSVKQLRDLIKKSGDTPLLVRIFRNDGYLFVTLGS